ncbi:hypothetical protein ERX27_00925 [Macrococcus brunensis]|uniref:Preprotein translocase subunit SecB n=1 Tax=Macrococcus brunensis TaxID=198483 RepID=A0A4R6BGS7_9STAP|nr:hypothetical protein [Macrococcus brunensis]TDL99038.1 hypothetical protein ERX27_00925 [Macrococcus brunensis]ULG72430.1 hypothetical protein MGG12_02615 [Macrococcus brunensis]ULG74684.1 hypothetical protein MGG13_02655 [Macrococcus brunensis]
MELHKQVVHMHLKELHVRDFSQHSPEITKMHRIDIEQHPEDNDIFEFTLNFMFGHFGTQVDGVIQATIIVKSEDPSDDVLQELLSDEKMYAVPLFSKASAIITKITEDRGMFPVIVPVELWLEE